MNEIMLWFKNSLAWNSIDASFTLVSMLVTLLTLVTVIQNYFKNQKQLDNIEIYINDKPLEFKIVRKHVTRVEVLGILGMLRKNMKVNYNVEHISKTDFVNDIYKIQTGKLDKLTIVMTSQELKQFK